MKNKHLLILLIVFVSFSFVQSALAQAVVPPTSTGVTSVDTSGTAAAAAIALMQFMTSVKVSMIVAWAIHLMKKSKIGALSWISTNTPWAARVLSAGGAAFAAAGITWTYNQAGDFVIHGLLAAAIGKAVWHTVINFGMQKGWYKQVFNNDVPGPTAQIL